MKKKQIIFLLLVAFNFIVFAQKETSFKYEVSYNKIETNTKGYSSQFSNDSIYIFFVEKYMDDNVQIFVDNKLRYTKKLKTNDSYLGLTDWFVIKNEKYKLIQFALNKDYVAFAWLQAGFNVIDISHKKDKYRTEIMFINFYNQLPSFE